MIDELNCKVYEGKHGGIVIHCPPIGMEVTKKQAITIMHALGALLDGR